MKIISNDEVYIQGCDLERLLQNDRTFPLDMYYGITKGMSHVKSLTKFIKIEGEYIKEHIKNSVLIPDFKELYICSIDELENKSEIIRKMKMNVKKNS